MGQRIKWALVGALAAVVLGGGAAFATTRLLADGPTIHACAQKQTGALRLSSDASCGPSEVPVSWSQQGPAGPPGPPGPAGSAGLSAIDDLDGVPCTTMRGDAGETYISHAQGQFFFGVSVACVRQDGYEPNDARAAATPVALSPYSTILNASVFPAGDDDWYTLSGTPLSSVGMNVSTVLAPHGTPLTLELYRDGVLVASGTQSGDPGYPPSLFWSSGGDTAPHDWLFHVTSPAVQTYSISISR